MAKDPITFPIGIVELPALDMKRAIKFYKNLLRWQLSEHDPDFGYATLASGGKDAGSMLGLSLTKKKPPRNEVVPFFIVTHTETYVNKAVKLGGSVVLPPVNVFGQVRWAKVTDSEGNVIGLWGPYSEKAERALRVARRAEEAAKKGAPAKKAPAKKAPAKKAPAKKAPAKKASSKKRTRARRKK